ncbi:TKL family protein kinase [Trichomonas vaginalis G3]|uniref:TKL family protein kinase n=1 Tax=Trichomonas vaginalis (strain ATCC PRA-98 / G3) TaxID=412133 RepID=A2FSF7_TRIV3|nr:protein kinase protein [Trichomonas vaginalis G3]EAX92154.1 TKL family protein kinase [Trichomonas vaginalis G3]KAI5538932.1 protein kinase protein [Trichomonas vaginalis G3]|eukprot:XP_001305084.1 TKL family protein kinase [Trichomonas vaginalis G3]
MKAPDIHSPYEKEEFRKPKIIKAEDLTFEKVIGSGGFGEVWIGNYIPSNTKVAIKKLFADELSEQTMSEISLHASLSQQFLVPFIGYTNEKPLCIVTQYISNGSLYDALHNQNPQVSLSPTDLTIIAFGIASGMAYIHSRNIIHRDLKTLNILLDSQLLPKIIDFGTSSSNKSRAINQDVGTAAIMAPELHRFEKYDQSVDVYSYGIILWEMLTHDIPFGDKEPVQIVYCVAQKGERPILPNDVPIPLMKLINSCWAEDPKQRPAFSEICAKFLSGEVSFKGSVPQAFRRYLQNFQIATISDSFTSPVEFVFPENNLFPPSELKLKNSAISGIQFEIPQMTTDEVINIVSVPDHPRFEEVLDFIEEHMTVIDEIGEKFWPLFLPLLTSNHYKSIDRILNILLYAAKKRSLLQHIVKVQNPYMYLSPKSLEIFLYAITYYPEVADTMFVMHLQVLLLKSTPEDRFKSITILCKIIEKTEDEELKSQIVEFLFSASDKFISEPSGLLALKTVVVYKTETINDYDLGVVCLKYLNSKVTDNIVTAYQVISCYPRSINIPIPLIYEHLQRKETNIVNLAIEALRMSLHIDDIEEVSQTVLELLKCYLNSRQNRALLLIFALADTSLEAGASAIQVYFQEAICSAIFSISDDVAPDLMPLIVLLFRVHLAFFMNHPILPKFTNSIFRFGDNEAFCVMCQIISHFNLEQGMADSFDESGALETLALRVAKTKSSSVVEYGSLVISLFLRMKYFNIFDICIPSLATQVRTMKKLTPNSLIALSNMSKYPQSVLEMKRTHVLDSLRVIQSLKEVQSVLKPLIEKLN